MLLPCNTGSHTAYQDSFVSQFLKFYTDPFALLKDTWLRKLKLLLFGYCIITYNMLI